MQPLISADQQRLQELATVYPLVQQVAEPQELARLIECAFATSPALARTLVARGGAWIDQVRVVDPAAQIMAGSELRLHTPPGGQYARPIFTAGQILLEDSDWLIINKPPGWYCVATPWDIAGTLERALHDFLLARDGQVPPLHLAHRLDRDTSGALVVTKNPLLNGPLQRLFSSGQVAKRYQAWSSGAPAWDEYELRTGHSRGERGLWTLYPAALIGQPHGPNGRIVREARTSFRVRERVAGWARIEAALHTGRTHQIRLHLAELGLPILGDGRYGGEQQIGALQLKQHLLHAGELRLPHPLRGTAISIIAAPPSLWERAEALLRSEACRFAQQKITPDIPQ